VSTPSANPSGPADPGRGTYVRRDADSDVELLGFAARAKDATVCPRSALSRHDLIDDIAIPRGGEEPPFRAPVVVITHAGPATP
jgi:hypothetical protein